MFDNFAPDRGNPLLARSPRDARTLIAVDRGRVAWPELLASGCSFTTSDTARGPLAQAAIELPPGVLAVVPDRYAPHLGQLGLAVPALVVSATDVRRHGRAGLPCHGPVYWLAEPGTAPPAPLVPLPSASKMPRLPAKRVGRWLVLERQ
jgi:hypothetical protein